jgi:hypothetical protein
LVSRFRRTAGGPEAEAGRNAGASLSELVALALEAIMWAWWMRPSLRAAATMASPEDLAPSLDMPVLAWRLRSTTCTEVQ